MQSLCAFQPSPSVTMELGLAYGLRQTFLTSNSLLGYLQWASEDGEIALGTAEGRIWPAESLLTGNDV